MTRLDNSYPMIYWTLTLTLSSFGGFFSYVEVALNVFMENDDVRIVILSGAGGKAFVSGADISKFEKERGSKDATEHYNARLKVVYDTIENYPKPTMAMINGHCIGGGLNLAACTDIRVASDKSRFAMPAAKLALGYPFDAIRRLVNSVGAASAKQLMFTAKSIDADTAFHLPYDQPLFCQTGQDVLSMQYLAGELLL